MDSESRKQSLNDHWIIPKGVSERNYEDELVKRFIKIGKFDVLLERPSLVRGLWSPDQGTHEVRLQQDRGSRVSLPWPPTLIAAPLTDLDPGVSSPWGGSSALLSLPSTAVIITHAF